MNTRETGCLALAAALALGTLTGVAAADDATPRVSSPRATATAPGKRARVSGTARRAPVSPAHEVKRTLGLPATISTPLAAPKLGTSAALAPSGSTLVASSNADAARMAAPSGGVDAWVLAQRLFDDQTPIELFTSVIAPAARGVTIAQIQPEGKPPVTLALRPTKITRGSGLVAVGLF